MKLLSILVTLIFSTYATASTQQSLNIDQIKNINTVSFGLVHQFELPEFAENGYGIIKNREFIFTRKGQIELRDLLLKSGKVISSNEFILADAGGDGGGG